MPEPPQEPAQQDRPETRSVTRTSWRYDLLAGAAAFVIWGAWAFFINRTGAAGGAPPWISGLTQGTSSFLTTLVMVRAVAWLYHHLGHFPGSLLLPAVIVVSVTGIFLATAHAIVGTWNIIGTITPPLSMALAFMIYTTVVLRRQDRKRGS